MAYYRIHIYRQSQNTDIDYGESTVNKEYRKKTVVDEHITDIFAPVLVSMSATPKDFQKSAGSEIGRAHV